MDVEYSYPHTFESDSQIKQPTVLLIEDSEETSAALDILLKSLQFQTQVVSDVKSAIQILTKKVPDIILCDLQLPNHSGMDLFNETRKHSAWSEVPFVFITGSTNVDAKSSSLRLGADDFLKKPIDPSELKATLEGKLKLSQYRKDQEKVRFDNFKKRIIHTLSHEFRTPLVSITTGTELLIDEYKILNDDQVITLLKSILKGGQRLERLVEDFMIMQQIDVGYAEKSFEQYKCKVSVVEICDLLHMKVKDYIKTQYSNPDFQLRIDPRIEFKMLEVYADQVIDALFRFIDNGLKFSAPQSKVHISIAEKEGFCFIEVRDWGSGFAEGSQVALKCVQPFEQINRDVYEQQGCGLGLSIASYFLSLHRADVRIIRPENQTGTVVEIRLPFSS